MAYYHVADIALPEPPPPPEADPTGLDKDALAAWKKEAAHRHKIAVDQHKVRVEKQTAQLKEVHEYAYAVLHVATGKVMCMCQGKSQADYIAMLLGDRPHT